MKDDEFTWFEKHFGVSKTRGMTVTHNKQLKQQDEIIKAIEYMDVDKKAKLKKLLMELLSE